MIGVICIQEEILVNQIIPPVLDTLHHNIKFNIIDVIVQTCSRQIVTKKHDKSPLLA